MGIFRALFTLWQIGYDSTLVLLYGMHFLLLKHTMAMHENNNNDNDSNNIHVLRRHCLKTKGAISQEVESTCEEHLFLKGQHLTWIRLVNL